jgi:hypothetical protein
MPSAATNLIALKTCLESRMAIPIRRQFSSFFNRLDCHIGRPRAQQGHFVLKRVSHNESNLKPQRTALPCEYLNLASAGSSSGDDMPSPRVLMVSTAVILVGAMRSSGPAEPADIGHTSTKGGEGQPEEVVKPNATTNRADALEEKKDAPNIIEVQPLSEIIKLPNINMAEALQRIPGISLETDSGEGRFVDIRGLDSDLNGTTYAGVRLPASNPSSPFGGGRATAFDTFPTGIVGGVELTKTLRPDTDAEALGGSINLVPRSGAEHGGEPFHAARGRACESLR